MYFFCVNIENVWSLHIYILFKIGANSRGTLGVKPPPKFKKNKKIDYQASEFLSYLNISRNVQDKPKE